MKITTISHYLLVFLLLNSTILLIKAQDVQITTTKLAIVEKKLEISYEYVKSKKKHRFDVWLEISTDSGKKLNARALSGNIGDNLAGGKDKKIIWDFNADGIVLDEEINVKVKAIVSTVPGAVNTGKVILQSVVMPGWGLSTINPEKPYWLLGVAGYAAIGSSLYFRSSYKKKYNSYTTEPDPLTSDNLISKSESQKALSGVFTLSAVGIWTVGMIWTALKANKNNSSLSVLNKNQKIQFYSSYNPKFKSSWFSLKYNF